MNQNQSKKCNINKHIKSHQQSRSTCKCETNVEDRLCQATSLALRETWWSKSPKDKAKALKTVWSANYSQVYSEIHRLFHFVQKISAKHLGFALLFKCSSNFTSNKSESILICFVRQCFGPFRLECLKRSCVHRPEGSAMPLLFVAEV